MSQDAPNDPPPWAYIGAGSLWRFLEPPTLSHWWEECGRF